nr:MAG TPA: hypothetical protein [Caudoviricetes sp.]
MLIVCSYFVHIYLLLYNRSQKELQKIHIESRTKE